MDKIIKEIESKCWDLPSHITRSQRLTHDQAEIIKQSFIKFAQERIKELEDMKKEPKILESKTPEERLLKSIFGKGSFYSVEGVNAYNEALEQAQQILAKAVGL